MDFEVGLILIKIGVVESICANMERKAFTIDENASYVQILNKLLGHCKNLNFQFEELVNYLERNDIQRIVTEILNNNHKISADKLKECENFLEFFVNEAMTD